MALIISIIAALFAFVLAIDLSWSNLLSTHRNNIVFEGRFKEYGAYKLRRENHKSILMAMFLTFGFVTISSILLIPDEIKKQIPFLQDISTPMTLPPLENIIESNKQEASNTKKSDNTSSSNSESSQKGNATPIVSETAAAAATQPTGGTPTGEEELHTPSDPTVGEKGKGNGVDSSQKALVIHDFTEFAPQFPGGEKAFQEYIRSHIEYPEWEKSQGRGGRLYMTFVVLPDGSIDYISTVRGFQGSQPFEKEAKRVLKNMPKWTPGKMGAKPVAVRLNIPLDFQVR